MPKRLRVRLLMDSEHVKWTETLIKIEQHYFCQIVLTL